jgi:hypothetical protein
VVERPRDGDLALRRDARQSIGLGRREVLVVRACSELDGDTYSSLACEGREHFEVVADLLRERRIELVEAFRFAVREQRDDALRLRSEIVSAPRAEVGEGMRILATNSQELIRERSPVLARWQGGDERAGNYVGEEGGSLVANHLSVGVAVVTRGCDAQDRPDIRVGRHAGDQRDLPS